MDKSNFERLFRENFTPLTNIANAVVRDKDTACDIVQHVFIKLWTHLEKVEITSSEKSYLHRAVVNTAINYIEKNKRIILRDSFSDLENNIAIDPDENDREIRRTEINTRICEVIDELPEKCRAVFSLSRIEGMKNAEIAEHLDVSVKTVEKHIGKALKHLRFRLKDTINALLIILLLGFNN